MLEVKSIGVIRCGIVLAVLYAIGGIFEALILVPIMAMAPTGGANGMPGFLKPIFGLGAFIIFPIMFAIGGFIGGMIGALIYNLVARWTGGLQITVAPVLTGAEVTVV